MSILIKGMWTTKDGCVDIRIWGNGAVEILRGYNRFIVDGAKAIELPPHGRLIDVSELEKRLYDYGTGTTLPIDWSDIANAPTVIEAEEGDG